MLSSRLTCWVLVVLAMAMVGWIRYLPQSLGAVDAVVDRLARPQLQERHPSQDLARAREMAGQSLRERLRSERTYTGDDGQEFAYLGDRDSYLFLRHARTFLRTGTPCDAVVDGTCRDTHALAPVGARTPYARSLHVAAIVAVHKVITWFRPAYPLPASAFFVPVIAGVLGVLPAFFVARGLAGTTAGLFAAVLTGIHPVVLNRTIGSDNDVWNVVLPLYVLWAAMAALAAATPPRGALWAGLAGIAIGLQAWAWRGWLFTYVVLMAGLVGAALAYGARYAIRHRTPRVWQAPGLRRTALVLVVFYAVAGVGAGVVDPEQPYFAIPAAAIRVPIHAAGRHVPDGGDTGNWPSMFTGGGITELKRLGLSDIAQTIGGVAFFGSLLGLLLLVLPERRWQWRHWAVFAGGALAYLYGLFAIEPSRVAALALLGAPLGVALIASWWSDEEPPAAPPVIAFAVIVWFLAAVGAAYGGWRFLLLLVPSFGIACGVAVGRLDTWLRSRTEALPRRYRAGGVALLAGVLALALLHPVRSGYAVARNYMPAMHDAWWDALGHLRETADPDAIVHTYWDTGHWVAYATERRVSNDGASLQTHVPHWFARALVAPHEAQSVGVLRMLSCGSDATPLPEGAQGAYGKLRATGRDPVSAYAILSDLVTLDEAAAVAYLAQRDFTPGEREAILRSTHCDPPETYLVLSSALVPKLGSWMELGLWDPRSGQRTAPSETASSEDEGPASRSRQNILANDPLGLHHSPLSARPTIPFVWRWLPCRPAPDGSMTCEINRGLLFTYRPGSPEAARLRLALGGSVSAGATVEGTPAAVLLVGSEPIRQVEFASPTHPGLGVLIDIPGARILVGALPLLQSTFVHLMYLDGRYAKHYRKFDDRAVQGERVVVWSIRW